MLCLSDAVEASCVISMSGHLDVVKLSSSTLEDGMPASLLWRSYFRMSVWSPSQNVCGHHTAQNKNEFVAASPSVPCTGSNE